jgi:hypothetical protein
VKITVELHGGPRDGEKVTVSKGATEYNVKGSENDGAYVVKGGSVGMGVEQGPEVTPVGPGIGCCSCSRTTGTPGRW